MKIKEKMIKKALITQIQECKTRCNNVIAELRNHTDLSHLSNEVIAKLNDMAYKGLNSGNLKKLLDKRALKNKDIFDKLEEELNAIVAKYDFKKI